MSLIQIESDVDRLRADNRRLRASIAAAADLLISALEDERTTSPVSARQRLRLVVEQ